MAKAVSCDALHPGHSLPATETSSERVFSPAGRTVEERRTQLSADAVDDLLFVHGLKN